MSGIQLKLTNHIKKQEIKPIITKLKPNKPEITQMIDVVDKNIKTSTINVFHMFQKTKQRLEMLIQTWETIFYLNTQI